MFDIIVVGGIIPATIILWRFIPWLDKKLDPHGHPFPREGVFFLGLLLGGLWFVFLPILVASYLLWKVFCWCETISIKVKKD